MSNKINLSLVLNREGSVSSVIIKEKDHYHNYTPDDNTMLSQLSDVEGSVDAKISLNKGSIILAFSESAIGQHELPIPPRSLSCIKNGVLREVGERPVPASFSVRKL